MAGTVGRSTRWVGAAGIAAAVLLLAAGLLTAGAPFPDASVPKILAWYQQHRLQVEISASLGGLGIIPFLCFAAGIRNRFGAWREETGSVSGVLFGGAVGLMTVSSLDHLPGFALMLAANRPGAGPSAGTVHLLADLSFFQHPASGGMAAVFMGALGLLALREGFATRWIGWMAVVAATLGVVGGTGAVFPSLAGKPSPASALGFVGFLLTMLTVVLSGTVCLIRSGYQTQEVG